MRRSSAAIAVLAAGAVLAGVVASAADWPQWRGPSRAGVTAEPSGHPEGWPPERLWARNVGAGCTSPVIGGDAVYVLGYDGPKDHRRDRGKDILRCLDLRSGDVRWQRAYPSRWQGRHRRGDTGRYGGPNATPTYDPDTGYLYTVSIDGRLHCWNTRKKGEPVWNLSFYDEYEVPQRPDAGGGRRDYGYATSPLIHGDALIVEVGSPARGTLMAFDKRTGKPLWGSQYKEPAGHTSGPVLLTAEGVPCVANLALRHLVVVRIDKGHEGETIAKIPWQTHFANNTPTPAVIDNRVIVTSSYNISRTAMFEISLKGAERLWITRSHAKVGSPVVHGGRVFLVHGKLRCLNVADGEEIWSGGRFDHGTCLVTGDDKVIAFGRGDVALVDAAADEYRELSRVRGVVRDVCYPHVTLGHGVLLCKDRGGQLVAFGVSAEKE